MGLAGERPRHGRDPNATRLSGATGLFALGPLCQGSLWEITAVPEIVRQADAAANAIGYWMQACHLTRATARTA
jgi:uncharacterized NAD(P)/FAD-binding protein YdhS